MQNILQKAQELLVGWDYDPQKLQIQAIFRNAQNFVASEIP